MRARVFVTLKREVLDPQGEAVKKGLATLGLDGVREVRVGKVIDVEVDGDRDVVRAKLEDAAKELLANLVIEDYAVELGE
jgi:phosphoribosylformylglycinamidine synthase